MVEQLPPFTAWHNISRKV